MTEEECRRRVKSVIAKIEALVQEERAPIVAAASAAILAAWLDSEGYRRDDGNIGLMREGLDSLIAEVLRQARQQAALEV